MQHYLIIALPVLLFLNKPIGKRLKQAAHSRKRSAKLVRYVRHIFAP